MIDFDKLEIKPTKHFALGWMRKWGFDINDIRNALKEAKIEKIGKTKYEAYFGNKNKGKKLIYVINEEENKLLIITGVEGK